MKEFAHLAKFERTLYSGAEWPVKSPHWTLLQLQQGIAYLQAGQKNEELPVGAAVAIPPGAAVIVRASVLENAQLLSCAINVGSLAGLVTAEERTCLETEAAQACIPFRLIAAAEPLALTLERACHGGAALNLASRLALINAFGQWISPLLERALRTQVVEQSPKARLKAYLNQVPETELTDLSLGDVARFLGCCERHASRIFREVCGSSLRAHLSDLRLRKACQMLAQGDYKIIDVALESGHSSLALFNLNFKSRFRMTPSQWRQRHVSGESRSVGVGLRGDPVSRP